MKTTVVAFPGTLWSEDSGPETDAASPIVVLDEFRSGAHPGRTASGVFYVNTKAANENFGSAA